ncbi:MAG: DUF1653 domain-containing protein [Gallintestinimicrobium sp.]
MKRLQKGTGGKLMNQIPQAGEIYQHFKGKLYRIVALATHTETGEQTCDLSGTLWRVPGFCKTAFHVSGKGGCKKIS